MVLDLLAALAHPIIAEFDRSALQVTIFSAGLALYGIVIWHYYRLLAKRDFFRFQPIPGGGRRAAALNALREVGFVLKYLILFPVITFVLFAVLSSFLFLLAKEQSIEAILLISITIISGTRIAAYYSEDLARDLAKLIPLALLGVFLVQPNFFSVDLFYERLLELPSFQTRIAGFILYTLVLEIVLKILLMAKRAVAGGGMDQLNAQPLQEPRRKPARA